VSERAPFCMLCLAGATVARGAVIGGIDPVSAAQGTCATTIALVAHYGVAAVRAALCEEHKHRAQVDRLVEDTASFDPRARA
jgi:hypothetical protein